MSTHHPIKDGTRDPAVLFTGIGNTKAQTFDEVADRFVFLLRQMGSPATNPEPGARWRRPTSP